MSKINIILIFFIILLLIFFKNQLFLAFEINSALYRQIAPFCNYFFAQYDFKIFWALFVVFRVLCFGLTAANSQNNYTILPNILNSRNLVIFLATAGGIFDFAINSEKLLAKLHLRGEGNFGGCDAIKSAVIKLLIIN